MTGEVWFVLTRAWFEALRRGVGAPVSLGESPLQGREGCGCALVLARSQMVY